MKDRDFVGELIEKLHKRDKIYSQFDFSKWVDPIAAKNLNAVCGDKR
jgi:hypothetical protein